MKGNGRSEEEYQKVEAYTFFWCTIGMAINSVLGGYLYTLHPQLPYSLTTVVALGPFIGYLMEQGSVATTFGLSAVVEVLLVLPSAIYLSYLNNL